MSDLWVLASEMKSKLNHGLILELSHEYGTTIPEFIYAAVLIPFVYIDNEWHLLFTRRTNTVSDHKGQVSFPGGAREDSDQNPKDTALRETMEEIGIGPEDIETIGELPGLNTITHYYITPIIGIVRWPIKIKLAEDEVERVFTVPVSWLSDSRHHQERPYEGIGNQIREVIFYDIYDGETIWGITAAITECIIERLR